MCGSLCLRVFTYPSFEEVPCVVDSADSTRPPTPCTVQSQSHRLNSVEADTHGDTCTSLSQKPSKHTHTLHKYIYFAEGNCSHMCLYVCNDTPSRRQDGDGSCASREIMWHHVNTSNCKTQSHAVREASAALTSCVSPHAHSAWRTSAHSGRSYRRRDTRFESCWVTEEPGNVLRPLIIPVYQQTVCMCAPKPAHICSNRPESVAHAIF